MRFGRFFGMTVPMIIVAHSDYGPLLKILNNENDNDRLHDLSLECSLFLNFFDSLSTTYASPEDKRKSVAYKRSIGDTSKRKLTKEEEEKAGISPNANIVISNVVKDLNGDKVSLTGDRELEYEIICALSSKVSFVEKLNSKIKYNVFNVGEAFGTKLYDWKDGKYLNYVISNKFRGNVSKYQIDDAKSQIKKMHDYFVDFVSDSTNFEEVSQNKIEDVVKDVRDLEFSRVIGKGSLFKYLKPSQNTYLKHLWDDLCTVDVNTFKNVLNISKDYSKEDYIRAFRNLDHLGLVGLNFCSKELFALEIKDIFGLKSKMSEYSPSLVKNICLCERILENSKYELWEDI